MGELGRRTVHLFAPYWSRVAVIVVSLVVFDRALFVPGGPRLNLLWLLCMIMLASSTPVASRPAAPTASSWPTAAAGWTAARARRRG